MVCFAFHLLQNLQILPNELNICDWQSPVPQKSLDIFPISAHDGPVSHWDELCPKKSSVGIAHIFFGKPSLSNLAKGWVTILQKHFSEIKVWVCREKIVPKQLISNHIFERPNIFIQFCSRKKKLHFPYFQALKGHCFCSFEFDLLWQRRYTA